MKETRRKKIMILLERKETGCARCDIRPGIINYIVCPSKLFPPSARNNYFSALAYRPRIRAVPRAPANINNFPGRARCNLKISLRAHIFQRRWRGACAAIVRVPQASSLKFPDAKKVFAIERGDHEKFPPTWHAGNGRQFSAFLSHALVGKYPARPLRHQWTRSLAASVDSRALIWCVLALFVGKMTVDVTPHAGDATSEKPRVELAFCRKRRVHWRSGSATLI